MAAASSDELEKLDALWRASNYLAAAMIYLSDNPLLQAPLEPEHVKLRLLGHWGSSPGLAFCYLHLSRLVRQRDLDAIFLAGPGHGAPGVLAPTWLEGSYGEVYPEKSAEKSGIDGLRRFLREFSFPGGIGSHCTPELPGSIHEGGELGYSLSHAFGAAYDNPDLLVSVVVGDGEAETGPLATSWHGNKFLNPAKDGAVLPILHLNGYKINNPTLLARISHEELHDLLSGYGWTPCFVEGCEPAAMHAQMAETLAGCLDDIASIQRQAREHGETRRPRWPMIVLRSPKGWTGPGEVDGRKVEDFWRAHQVPLAGVRDNPAHLAQLEAWLKGYRPEELFDANGVLRADLRSLLPEGARRMSANPHANGGLLRRPLQLPDIRTQAVEAAMPGAERCGNTRPLGRYLAEVMRANHDNFRVFSPDENASNKLDDLYAVTGKAWMAAVLPEDADGGHLAADGRVMEMLSEHTLEGWLEGYLLTGRHGLLSTYEAFAHVIDSMYNQHAKWLAMAREIPWRAPISSLNLLITSTVWRQDHNGFTHQDPGFLDVAVNKSPHVARIYLPPDANCLLAVSRHCLQTTNRINVIVADKQEHLQYLDIAAAEAHCAAGIGVWEWASTGSDRPDLVMACAGDVATQESLAAVELLRGYFPDLKIRFVNVVDLFTLTPQREHPHGLGDADYDRIFPPDCPTLFNFHGYPYLVHRLAYRRNNHDHLHVRGYMEQGSIDTPLVLAIRNRIDRFSLACDAIKLVASLADRDAAAIDALAAEQRRHLDYALDNGVDSPEISG